MATEIERKYLVTGNDYRTLTQPIRYRQGYLCLDTKRIVRVRIKPDRAILAVKSIMSDETRLEFEYEIDMTEANVILDELCEKPIIEKDRYKIEYHGFKWDVDEFMGENAGLVVAEVNLDNEDQQVPLPGWVGKDVSKEPKYLNCELIRNPYSKW